MDIDVLTSVIRSIDKNNSFLIIVLCCSAVYLIREILRPPPWLIILACPSVLAAGFIGTGVMKMQSWFISGVEAVNTVVGSVAGITLCFCIGAILCRAFAEFYDETKSGPYRPRNKPTVE